VAVLLLIAATAWEAAARELTFPLVVDYGLLRAALASRLREQAPEGALWGRTEDCRSMVVDDVRMDHADGKVMISLRGNARVGVRFIGFCLVPIRWDGFLDTRAVPRVGPDWQLRFADLESQLYDRQHHKTVVGSRVWDLVRGSVEEELGRFAFDLAPPIEEARDLVRATALGDRAAPLVRALDGLRPVETVARPDGIAVTIALDLPDTPSAPGAPEAALGPVDLARWQRALESWDAFLVFVIKNIGALTRERESRDRLLDVLLRGRAELLAILAGGPVEGGDPVRRLFLDSWERLRSIVRDAAARGDLDDRAARYLSFVAAGDALAALDAASPALGIEISADGLRRLARVLDPESVVDPVQYSDDPDPALRELFEFQEPVPLSAPADGPPAAAWWWPLPMVAHAAPAPLPELAEVLKRLDRWVPAGPDMETYRDAIGRLLATVAARTAEQHALDRRFTALYPDLVRTTAWQESCWRQFVERDGKVTYLASTSGDIGIMQVNRRVWRGFFDLEKLRWEIGYNVGAGAEILVQLLTRYGSREAETRLENAARATYAAYNGGPDAYQRYRRTRVPRALRAIDEAFWDKYQAMAAGRALDFVLCIADWPAGRRPQLSTAPEASTPKRSISSLSSRATSTSPSRHSAIASRPRASFA
jgi:hypothetical protein